MRAVVLILCSFFIASCSITPGVDDPAGKIGDATFGTIVPLVVSDIEHTPLSRFATEEEWKAVVGQAMNARFENVEGTKVFHLGVQVLAYFLARPGVPIVASPQSFLIVNVFVLDDSTGEMILDEPHKITVSERLSGKTLFGSGITQTKEEQMAELAAVAAKEIENWLAAQPFVIDENKVDPVLDVAPEGEETPELEDPVSTDETEEPVVEPEPILVEPGVEESVE